MAVEISLSLEETNAIRKQLGLKPIEPEKRDHKFQETNSTIERKDEPLFMDIDKVALLRKRLARLSRSTKDPDDLPLSNEARDDDWLSRIGKRTRKPVTVVHEENPQEDLPFLQLSHNLKELDAGKDVVLTLKESSINDEHDDVLEDAKLAQRKQVGEKLRLKQLNKDRRSKKVDLKVSSLDFEKEQEERNDNTGSVLLIGSQSNLSKVNEDTAHSPASLPAIRRDRVRVQFDDEASDGYDGDFQPVKIKKRKKRDIKNRVKVPSEIRPVQLVDEDVEVEEELNLAPVSGTLLKNNTHTPDEIASQIRKEKLERQNRSSNLAHLQKNTKLIIDENVEFLESLKVNTIEEDRRVHDHPQPARVSDNPSQKHEKNFEQPQEESLDFSNGLASTLQFLKERDILPSRPPSDKHASLDDVRHSGYNPDVNLVYRDEKGNELTTKEAYKKLSQRFHGTKSNEKKRAKFEARVQARARLQDNEMELT